MNTKIKVLPVRLDKARGNCSVSRRAVLEKSKNAEITEALKNIKVDDIVDNAIVKIKDPEEYLKRLEFHKNAKSFEDYLI